MQPNSADRWSATLSAARTITRFCTEKIGWNRIGFLVSVAIIAIAVAVLYRILQDIEPDEILEALRTSEPRNIALAALFVAGAYFTLTFYDLFALRTIGHGDLPYRVAALAGFTSYSVGHNVGASVFTGGAVRYRIYSVWGLDAIAVAKICFIAGLTFWLGNATVLGLGIAYEPNAASAINQLPPWINRIVAITALLILASYVAWVWRRPRVIGRRGWQVTLPGGPLTLLQIAIGIIDLGFCALAMYMLVPDEPNIGFVTLSVIFAAFTTKSIFSTFLITGAMFGALAASGYTTGADLTSWGSFLFMALVGQIIGVFVNIFWLNETLYWVTTATGGPPSALPHPPAEVKAASE